MSLVIFQQKAQRLSLPYVSEVYIKLFNFSFHSLGKTAVLVVSDSKSKGGRNIGQVVLEGHSQILEETRIQHPLQFTGRKKTLQR